MVLNSENKERQDNPINQLEGLLQLSHHPDLWDGNSDGFIRFALVQIAGLLQISRASYWTFKPLEGLIYCEALYNRAENSVEVGAVLYKKNFPHYFEAFENNLLINAQDAANHNATFEFKDSYLDPNNIKSMLDVQVSLKGQLLGVICLEQVGDYRIWAKNDELFVSSVAGYVAQCFLSRMRAEEEKKRKESESSFRKLFMDNPVPMFVYDPDTLKFLTTNKAATRYYGYSAEEFLKMSLYDIRPQTDLPKLKDYIKKRDTGIAPITGWHHRYKDGTVIYVEISSDWTFFNGKRARLVLAVNKTKEKKLETQKEAYMAKLTDYAFYASHHLRAPVASVLGLVSLVDKQKTDIDELLLILDHLTLAAKDLDQVISKLNSKVDL